MPCPPSTKEAMVQGKVDAGEGRSTNNIDVFWVEFWVMGELVD